MGSFIDYLQRHVGHDVSIAYYDRHAQCRSTVTRTIRAVNAGWIIPQAEVGKTFSDIFIQDIRSVVCLTCYQMDVSLIDVQRINFQATPQRAGEYTYD